MMLDATRISLAGEWTCVLDPEDGGIARCWGAQLLEGEKLALPGCLPAAGLGNPPGIGSPWTGTIFDRSFFESPRYARYRSPEGFKVPFWLQPERVYVGPAWFQRWIHVPEAWAGQTLHLFLERPHGHTRVWWDGEEIGRGESLSVPHRFLLGKGSAAGPHRLTVRVDNRLLVDVGENAHSVSDHTQGNWNGIVGRMELSRSEACWIDDLQVYPEADRGRVGIRARLAGSFGQTCRCRFRVQGRRSETPLAERALERPVGADGTIEFSLEHDRNVPLWDEFSPEVFQARLELENGECRTATFGFREVRTEGRSILVNGRRVFLRGALDCCAYPKTGYPPQDLASWREILGTVRAHGLNHVRFHSWCPPTAAFDAADELGIYLQVEASTWPNAVAVLAFNSPAGLGDGSPVDAWLRRETQAILREYGNHPSFILLASGNEPGGPHHRDYLSAWVRDARAADPRRLYTGAAGWPELPENDVHVLSDPRLHQWGDGLRCRLNGTAPATVADHRAAVEKRTHPVISHEIGQWCAYPPLYDTVRYTGYLKARNYEIFAESLRASGLADQARDFVRASGRLQALCYREEIETCLRTPELAGFQLLGLADFPGQGTAPVGVLDVFWRSKGYLDAGEMARYCGPSVLLARLPKRVFSVGERATVAVEIAHYGAAPLEKARVEWELRSEAGEVLDSGSLGARRVETGRLSRLGELTLFWNGLPAPAKYGLRLSLAGSAVEASWDLWLYPDSDGPETSAGVVETSDLAAALAALAAGGRVLLELPPSMIAGDVALGFSPIFWNTWCTQGQAPHTLGLLCRPAHPALRLFPTDEHTDWQWWHVLHGAGALVLEAFPPELRPLVQVIDDWSTNRRLGLVFEGRVGEGRLLVCGAPLATLANPVARQLRTSLLAYAAGDAFHPETELTEGQLRTLLR